MAEASVPATGGSGAVSVTAARDCVWSASVDGNWLSIKSGGNGQGEGTVEFTASANPDPQTRTGAVIVNGSRAQITQSAGECVITLASSSVDVSPSGGTARIEVRASSQMCTWNVTSDSPWIEVTSGATGRGNGTVTLSIAPTTGPPRAATVTVAGQRFSVTQSQGCTYAIDRPGHNAAASGSTTSVSVSTAAACPWTAASNVEWIAVSPAAGSGPAPVTISIAPTDGPQRTGSAVIAGQLFTVTQSPGCTYQVQPTSHTLGASGGNASVNVNTGNGCTWTSASSASWITFQGAMSGNGPGNVTFSVAATSGPGRSGTLIVAGHQITVSQSQGCSYSISPQSQSFESAGGNGRVTVTAGEGCTWDARSPVPWVTITAGSSGSGNGDVQFTVASTNGPSRSTTLTIAGHSFAVTQGQGCSVHLSPSTIDIGDEGGSRSFDVQTGEGCGWTASTTTPWIRITSSTSGSGNGTIRFTVDANSGPSRSGTITVSGQTFTVNQGEGCTFRLSPSGVNIDDDGGQRSFDVQVGQGCGWTARTNTPWITLNSNSGTGNGTVRFTVAANSGPSRSGSITVEGQTFTVTQGSGCSYALSPERHSVPAGGGSGTVSVTAGGGCSWNAASNAQWLSITSGATGSGNGSVGFSAASNNGAARTGTLTIANRTFTVEQAEACTYSINPTQQGIPGSGGVIDVSVIATDGCRWTASSNVSWISVTSGASGSGNGSVRLTVEQNGSGARNGTVTIAGRTFTVEQGSGCTYSISPASQQVPGTGGTSAVSVSTQGSCSWTASSNAAWIAVTAGASGTGNGTVQMNIEANIGPERTGTATIAGQTFTVTQTGSCSYTIAPTSQGVPNAGGTVNVNVTASQGSCGWTASSNASWIGVASGASGTGNGVVQLSVAANNGAPRTGTATIAGQTFTVNQESGCSFTVAPETIPAAAAAATSRVEVTAQSGCTWTAASNVSWITLTAGAPGNGNGAVEFAIAANNGPVRSGTLTVAGRTVTVNQESGCTVSINPTSQAIPATGGTAAVSVTAGPGCPWTAVSNAPWITITAGASGTGDGVVQFAVVENMTGAARQGTITIGTQTFTVNQQ